MTVFKSTAPQSSIVVKIIILEGTDVILRGSMEKNGDLTYNIPHKPFF